MSILIKALEDATKHFPGLLSSFYDFANSLLSIPIALAPHKNARQG